VATFFDLVVTRWGARFMGQRFSCAVGRGGIGSKIGEGDGITPKGTFRILETYARPDRALIGARPIRISDVWSDDPRDPSYNTLQPGPAYPFSHEKMRRADPMYDLVADLSFNREPPIAGKGSAIFMHVWRKPRHPTEGCVAFSYSDLHFILSNWTDKSRVVVKG